MLPPGAVQVLQAGNNASKVLTHTGLECISDNTDSRGLGEGGVVAKFF